MVAGWPVVDVVAWIWWYVGMLAALPGPMVAKLLATMVVDPAVVVLTELAACLGPMVARLQQASIFVVMSIHVV